MTYKQYAFTLSTIKLVQEFEQLSELETFGKRDLLMLEALEAEIKNRLEIIRKDIQAENVSTSQLLELQTLIPYIESGDIELLEWAGVPEFKE